MEYLSCHSNESKTETLTRNVTFVEANVMNIYFLPSFSFTPLMDSEEMMFENVFANLAFLLPWQPVKFSVLDKIYIFG